jgi:ribonuclease P protein component
MLSKKYRLTRTLAEVVVRRGQRKTGSFFVLKVAEIPKKWPSIAIVVPKRVVKTSVGRHRLKRLIAHSLFDEIPLLPSSKAVLFTVTRVPDDVNVADLGDEFRKLVS